MPRRRAPPAPARSLIASLLLAAFVAAADPARSAHDDGDWLLTFEDTFDGTTINTSNWRVANNIGHNLGSGELQAYFADEVSVSGGNLVLRTRFHPGELNNSGRVLPYNWTSGWVDSVGNVQFTFGKVEASIRLPKENNGVWPAFWVEDDADWPPPSFPPLWARTHCWPTGGEIDILEAFGGQDDESIKATYHWGTQCYSDDWWADGAKQGRAARQDFCGPGGFFSDAFHNFTLFWNASALTWAIDGRPYVSRVAGEPASLFIPQWPLWMILNTAIDSYHGQPPHDGYPVYMLVDRVSVWAWGGPSSGPGQFPIPMNVTLTR
jgi:hypothetical protein